MISGANFCGNLLKCSLSSPDLAIKVLSKYLNVIYYKDVSYTRLNAHIRSLSTLVLQEEHLQLPGWQVQEVHLQEAESQALVIVW